MATNSQNNDVLIQSVAKVLQDGLARRDEGRDLGFAAARGVAQSLQVVPALLQWLGLGEREALLLEGGLRGAVALALAAAGAAAALAAHLLDELVRAAPVPFTREGVSFTRERVLFTREGVPFTREGVPFTRERVSFTRERVSFTRERVSFTRERTCSCTRRSACCDPCTCGPSCCGTSGS